LVIDQWDFVLSN